MKTCNLVYLKIKIILTITVINMEIVIVRKNFSTHFHEYVIDLTQDIKK